MKKYSNIEVTGSFQVTGSMTVDGLLLLSGSVESAISASHAVTASFALTAPIIDYLIYPGPSSQEVGQGGVVLFGSLASGYNQGEITYNSTNGQFTLKAGKKYELETSYYATTWSTPTTGFLYIDFGVVSGTGTFVQKGSTVVPATHTTERAGTSIARAFIAPTTDMVVRVEVPLASGTAELQGNRTCIIIKEIR